MEMPMEMLKKKKSNYKDMLWNMNVFSSKRLPTPAPEKWTVCFFKSKNFVKSLESRNKLLRE